MNQKLEQLIKLQGIDHRLLEIKEFMGDLPSTVESQELELKSLETNNNTNKLIMVQYCFNLYSNKIERRSNQIKILS